MTIEKGEAVPAEKLFGGEDFQRRAKAACAFFLTQIEALQKPPHDQTTNTILSGLAAAFANATVQARPEGLSDEQIFNNALQMIGIYILQFMKEAEEKGSMH